jgi:AcrR family transcriptional regulator
MVHSTFYNLEDQKKQRILDAAKKEFSSGGNPKISRIIQEAEIPRGSFYQYFDTLEDVLQALLEQVQQEKVSFLIEALHKFEGDIFESAMYLFEEELQFYSQPANQVLVTNLFKAKAFSEMEAADKTPLMLQLPVRLDNLRNPMQVLELIFLAVTDSIRKAVMRNMQIDEAKAYFAQYLEIIRMGAEI